MSDLIRRQDAIDVVKKWFDKIELNGDICIDGLISLSSALQDNQVHLCDSCKHPYPDCPSKNDDVIFGNGNWEDNICACVKYVPSAQQWKEKREE